MWGYIYKVTCIAPGVDKGKIYIGQHAKAKFSYKYKGSGSLITAAKIKYGEDYFKVELIERCKDQKELDEREQYWIKYYDSTNPLIGFNQSVGGRLNDAKMNYRKDREAVELREILNSKDPKKARMIALNDPSNWITIYRDNKTREVFKDKLQFYLDKGWKVLNF